MGILWNRRITFTLRRRGEIQPMEERDVKDFKGCYGEEKIPIREKERMERARDGGPDSRLSEEKL